MRPTLDQLLSEPIVEPAAPSATAQSAADRPADRPAPPRLRVDRSERWRFQSASILLWGFGYSLTAAVFVPLFGVAPGLVLAAMAQWVISNAELAVWARVGVLAKLAGLVLLGIDCALNVAGADQLMAGVSLTLDPQSPALWIAVGMGLLVAGLPEILWRAAQGK